MSQLEGTVSQQTKEREGSNVQLNNNRRPGSNDEILQRNPP
jgi:hypothetical protein